MTTPHPQTPPSISLLALFFVGSGFSALAYQVVLNRYAQLIVGATAYAISALLVAYMLGMSLGAALGGRWADRTEHPLRVYALAEERSVFTASASQFSFRGSPSFTLPSSRPSARAPPSRAISCASDSVSGLSYSPRFSWASQRPPSRARLHRIARTAARGSLGSTAGTRLALPSAPSPPRICSCRSSGSWAACCSQPSSTSRLRSSPIVARNRSRFRPTTPDKSRTAMSTRIPRINRHPPSANGALLGGAAGVFFRGRFTSVRLAAVSSLFTVAIALSSLFGMVARYPQLFADRWWLSGGARASLQRVLTHGVGANVLDAISVALLVGAVAVPSFRVLRYRRTLSKKLAVAAGIFAAIVTVRSARSDLGNGSKGVLIIATDSLRTESIEDPDVMPFTASRVEDGALYRYAVTPIARTYPAWASTLTGTEPRVHDVRHMFPMPISRHDVGPTLFTELRDRGYFTFATSDFTGDVFPGFEGGFEILDTPHFNVDTLAQSAVLSRHTWSLPLLRFRWFRDLSRTGGTCPR